jgi:hypothetical protein
MSHDSLRSIVGKLQLRCPLLTPELAEDFTVNAFRELAEESDWSWKYREHLINIPAQYATGTVTVAYGVATVIGTGTLWNSDMVGRQFRIGQSGTYTVGAVLGPTELELTSPWQEADLMDAGYRIFLCYITLPPALERIESVRDVRNSYELSVIQHSELNVLDPDRTYYDAQSWVLAPFDTLVRRSGEVGAAVQVVGAGDGPVASGAYTGSRDGLITVRTVGGAYEWRKDGGPWQPGIIDPVPVELVQGVYLSWEAGGVYVDGEVWVVQIKAGAETAEQRWEIWPHPTAQAVYPMVYTARPADLGDLDGFLPRSVPGNVLLDGALAALARWPGPDVDRRNPYFQIALAEAMEAKFRRAVDGLKLTDDNLRTDSLWYTGLSRHPRFDSIWAQKHDVPAL